MVKSLLYLLILFFLSVQAGIRVKYFFSNKEEEFKTEESIEDRSERLKFFTETQIDESEKVYWEYKILKIKDGSVLFPKYKYDTIHATVYRTIAK